MVWIPEIWTKFCWNSWGIWDRTCWVQKMSENAWSWLFNNKNRRGEGGLKLERFCDKRKGWKFGALRNRWSIIMLRVSVGHLHVWLTCIRCTFISLENKHSTIVDRGETAPVSMSWFEIIKLNICQLKIDPHSNSPFNSREDSAAKPLSTVQSVGVRCSTPEARCQAQWAVPVSGHGGMARKQQSSRVPFGLSLFADLPTCDFIPWKKPVTPWKIVGSLIRWDAHDQNQSLECIIMYSEPIHTWVRS